jgi:hypothetical protein
MAAEIEDRHKPLEHTAENLSKGPERTKDCADRIRYIGLIFVNHVGRKAAETVGWFGTVLNEVEGRSIIKHLMLYKQLFVPVIDCACPICVYATRTHVGKRQVVEEMDLPIGRCRYFALITSKFTRFRVTDFSLTTSEH